MFLTENGVNTWRYKTAIPEFSNFEKKSKSIFYHQNCFFHQVFENFQNFQKTVTYVLGGVFISMCTKFQVDGVWNDVFIAFETSKIATFHDIPVYYGTNRCFVYIPWCFGVRFLVSEWSCAKEYQYGNLNFEKSCWMTHSNVYPLNEHNR